MMEVVQRDSEAAIAVVEVGDQPGDLVAEEKDDEVIAADGEVAVDVSYCWMEGEAGRWIEEGAY